MRLIPQRELRWWFSSRTQAEEQEVCPVLFPKDCFFVLFIKTRSRSVNSRIDGKLAKFRRQDLWVKEKIWCGKRQKEC